MERADTLPERSETVNPTQEISLNLIVRDPEVILELCKYSEGVPRESFSLSALRLGVLSLRQACGVVDSASIREEGEHLLTSLRNLMAENSRQMLSNLSGVLKQYFDPNHGDLPQRLEQLVKKDGAIESLLARHLDGDTSTIARTLIKHVGEQSPLLRVLSPKQSDGLLATLNEAIQAALQLQREHVLRQFSLDDKKSALSRLVQELTGANGRLREDLSRDMAKVQEEFSLDNERGALSRLVTRIEKAHQVIAEQFSKDNEDSALCRMSRLLETTNATVAASLTLDNEESPLNRLRRELRQILEDLARSNTQFQSDVRTTLESFKVRREESLRSTVHGREFEEAVGIVFQHEAQRLGDIYQAVGNTTGSKPYCKAGDYIINLGPESITPGARIVGEAKEDKSYDAAKALIEIGTARENREAQVGIFVFSKATAPDRMEPVSRFGQDILVVWDRDDATTDVFLKAALSIARAITIYDQTSQEKSKADFGELEKSITRIAKDAEDLGEIITWGGTIKNNSQKILDKAERIRENIEKQIEILREHVSSLHQSTEGVKA